MAKRFTDTEKWNRPWYRSLPPAYKLLWDFICDRCDQLGVWYVDFDAAIFSIGLPLSSEEALRYLSKQVQPFGDGSRWFVRGFIEFQYGELKPTNNFHVSILSRLSKLQIPGVSTPLNVPYSGDKGKEKDKDFLSLSDRGEERRGEREPLGFADFWSAYPKKRSRGQALKAWRKLNPSIEQVRLIVEAINRAKTSTEWVKDGGQFIPYPATWLNAEGWKDEIKLPAQVKVDEFQAELQRRRELNERADRILSGQR